MGAFQGPPGRSDGRVSSKRVPGAHHRGTEPPKDGSGLELCVTGARYSPETGMPRYAFKLRIKPDAIEEYEREHQHVWPELLAKLKEVGISEYSIFRQDQDLFLCMRVDDFNRAWEALDHDPVNQRWQQAMSRLFEPIPVPPGQRFAM